MKSRLDERIKELIRSIDLLKGDLASETSRFNAMARRNLKIMEETLELNLRLRESMEQGGENEH